MTPAQFIDDPNWAEIVPEAKEGGRTRHLPAHEDCTPLDADAVAAHLMRGGTLGRLPGYEERPGQIDMLRSVVRAFNDASHLMIEAGTGVGKSLAYLVPAVAWSAANDTPVIVSTATRNLQAQLVGADIPRALLTLGDGAASFKTALLKGRGNYLCLRAVGEFFAGGLWTMADEEQAEMPHFIEWLRNTPDGDLDAYEGLPRGPITCPGEECAGRKCPYYSRCFVYKARKRAAEANLVVVNHALVLAEAANPGGGILPAYGRLVLDEAHNLESIATECMSCEFSLPNLARILNRLLRKGKGRRVRTAGGVLAAVARQLDRGVLAGGPVVDRVRRMLVDAPRLTAGIVSEADRMMDVAERLLRPAEDRGLCRYRVRDGVRAHSLHGLFKAYENWNENALLAAQTAFDGAVAALVNLLHDLRDTLDDSAPEGEFNYMADSAVQVGGVAESLVAFANEVNFVLKGEKDTHAYWIERVHTERRPAHLRLVAAPLSVADDLRRIFYDVKDSVVLSSATLRVGNDFRYMARRLGFQTSQASQTSRYRMLTAASPFDYFRQSLVLAPDCLPDPSANPGGYAEALAPMLRDLFRVTHGRALVLFTSYEMMNAVAAHARGALESAGVTLLVQGEGLSRESMTAALRRSGDTAVGQPNGPVVLFGAQSFWEGVDVAGDALSCVVLARLPFAQVGDPVIEARSEKIDSEGGKSFRDYALPEAVIRFRQGFGRLIRTRSDRGVVIVTDSRIVTKNYGSAFRQSIPATVHMVAEIPELLTRVAEFFETTE